MRVKPMNLMVQQGFIIFCIALIYLLLKLKSPPKNALRLINFMASLIFVLMIQDAQTIPQYFVANYKFYSFVVVEILCVTALAMFWRINFVWFLVGGTMCNMMVFMVNDWKMPVFYTWETYYTKISDIPDLSIVSDHLHIAMTYESHLNILGDWIVIKLSSPFYQFVDSIFSIGDVLNMIGIFLISYKIITWWIDKKIKKTV